MVRTVWVVAAIVAAIGCGKSGGERATMADCEKVADHVADKIVERFKERPHELWDGVHSNPGDTGIPGDVTRETFPAFIATDAGKAWMAGRHEQARTGTHANLDRCAGKQAKTWVGCMLAIKSIDDIAACDRR